MKTKVNVKSEFKKFKLFQSIKDNYINGNTDDYKKQLNKLNKVDLIKFSNFLSFYGYKTTVSAPFDIFVNAYNEIILCEI
jgi:hypothetical protein